MEPRQFCSATRHREQDLLFLRTFVTKSGRPCRRQWKDPSRPRGAAAALAALTDRLANSARPGVSRGREGRIGKKSSNRRFSRMEPHPPASLRCKRVFSGGGPMTCPPRHPGGA